MVSERKKQQVKMLAEEMKKFSVIGIVDMFKLPARQLQDIRDKMKGKAIIKMAKKSVIKLALEKSGLHEIKKIEELIQNQPALLMSNSNPFDLARIIESSKSSAPAKEGDIAPKDIVVKAGPTSLKPGPVIGELQRVKLPVSVEGDKLVVKSDTLLVKKGEQISKNIADVLAKLGVEPMEISLNVVGIWDNGIIYPKDILFVPLEKYKSDIADAYRNAFNLAYNTGYVTKDTLPLLIVKAYREAYSIALEAGIVTKETITILISKAHNHMLALKSAMPQNKAENNIDDKKEG